MKTWKTGTLIKNIGWRVTHRQTACFEKPSSHSLFFCSGATWYMYWSPTSPLSKSSKGNSNSRWHSCSAEYVSSSCSTSPNLSSDFYICQLLPLWKAPEWTLPLYSTPQALRVEKAPILMCPRNISIPQALDLRKKCGICITLESDRCELEFWFWDLQTVWSYTYSVIFSSEDKLYNGTDIRKSLIEGGFCILTHLLSLGISLWKLKAILLPQAGVLWLWFPAICVVIYLCSSIS